jgi:hypothetical protein
MGSSFLSAGLEMGYLWKRTRYVPTGKPKEEEVEGLAAEGWRRRGLEVATYRGTARI